MREWSMDLETDGGCGIRRPPLELMPTKGCRQFAQRNGPVQAKEIALEIEVTLVEMTPPNKGHTKGCLGLTISPEWSYRMTEFS